MGSKGIIMSVFIALAMNCYGQNYFDIAKIKNGFVPNNKFENSAGETVVNNFAVKITNPIVINEKLAVLTGVDYSNIRLKPLLLNKPVNLISSGIRLTVFAKKSTMI